MTLQENEKKSAHLATAARSFLPGGGVVVRCVEPIITVEKMRRRPMRFVTQHPMPPCVRSAVRTVEDGEWGGRNWRRPFVRQSCSVLHIIQF